MRFNTERDAWNHWTELYKFHGAEVPDPDEFFAWVDTQGVSWLDEDMAEFLREEWKNEL